MSLIISESLMLTAGHPVDVADNRGWQSVHEAAAGNYVACLELILQSGLYYIQKMSLVVTNSN